LEQFRANLKPAVIGNDDKSPVHTGLKAYDEKRRKLMDLLHMDEVFCIRKALRSVCEDGKGNPVWVTSDPSGGILSATKVAHLPFLQLKRKQREFIKVLGLGLAVDRVDERISRFVYLSHVMAWCGLREGAVKPLLRLLRVGYSMCFSKFKRLVMCIARKCNRWHDFARDLSAPTKGLRKIPKLLSETRTGKSGIQVPLWTYRRDSSRVRDLDLS